MLYSEENNVIYILEIFIRDVRINEYLRKENGCWYLPLEDPIVSYYTTVEFAENALLNYIDDIPEGYPIKVYGARISEAPIDSSATDQAEAIYIYDKEGNRIDDITQHEDDFDLGLRFSERQIAEYVHFNKELNGYVAELVIIGHNILNPGDYLVIRQPSGDAQDNGSRLFEPTLPMDPNIRLQLVGRHFRYYQVIKCLQTYKDITPDEIQFLREGIITEEDIKNTHERYEEQP